MDPGLFDISAIETFLDTLLRGRVADKVFFTALPPVTAKAWPSMVAVDIAGVADMRAYGRARVNIFLYARARPDGTKDVPELSRMEKSLAEAVAGNKDPHYVLTGTNNRYSDYDDGRDLHCNIIEYNLLII